MTGLNLLVIQYSLLFLPTSSDVQLPTQQLPGHLDSPPPEVPILRYPSGIPAPWESKDDCAHPPGHPEICLMHKLHEKYTTLNSNLLKMVAEFNFSSCGCLFEIDIKPWSRPRSYRDSPCCQKRGRTYEEDEKIARSFAFNDDVNVGVVIAQTFALAVVASLDLRRRDFGHAGHEPGVNMVILSTEQSGQLYANVTRDRWSLTHCCTTDILLFIATDYYNHGRIITTGEPYAFVALSDDLVHYFYRNVTLFFHDDHAAEPEKGCDEWSGLECFIYRQLSWVNETLEATRQDRAKAYLIRNYKLRQAPAWAVALLVVCSVAGLAAAAVGVTITKRNRSWGSLTGIKTAGRGWKAGFSGGVWAR